MKDLLAGMMVNAETPGRMTIINPFNGHPVRDAETGDEAYVDVLSDVGKIGSQWSREMTDKALQRKGRAAKAEILEEDLSDKAARLTVGWKLMTLAGVPIDAPFSRGNAREVYEMTEMSWLREQVLGFAGDLGNWRPTSSSNSSITPTTNSASISA
jgi:hypothetical protein